MATQLAETANPVAVIRQNLEKMEPEFKAALPPHIAPERFTRVAMTAIQNSPSLANADRRSLFGAFVKLAQDGLLPDGREAAVVMFGNKAQAMPMIGGILKRIRQSGEVSRVSAHVVYKNDTFTIRYGFDEDVEHIPPALDQPRGEPIGAYATAVLKDGSKLLEVMSLEEIEKVRAVSRAARNGPWVAWWTEMARKTVMRRLSKRLPMSTDLEDQVFSRDETLEADPARIRRLEAVADNVPISRLDAIEQRIDPPIESEVISEQAETIEAEIAPETDAFGLEPVAQGPDDAADTTTNDADPAQAKADETIAALEAAQDEAAVQAAVDAYKPHEAAMVQFLRMKVEVAISEARTRVAKQEATA